jgi:hypothetical protein
VTTADPAERLDLAPELRMLSYTFREEFGEPAVTIGRVAGQLTLLASGPTRLTVATPWGVIGAAAPRDDGVIELTRMDRLGKRERLTVCDAIAGLGPRWTGTGLRSARSGARMLIKRELPQGVGVGGGGATAAAIARCLGDHGAAIPQAEPATPSAMLAGDPLPFDLAAAGLRLMIIDTGVRGAAQPAPLEAAPVASAAQALAAGDFAGIGRLLTIAHDALVCHYAQQGAVTAALRGGALGARAITDGPGRPVCALLPASRLQDVRAAVRAWFTSDGLRPPRFLTFTPADESRRAWHDGPAAAAGLAAGEPREASG